MLLSGLVVLLIVSTGSAFHTSPRCCHRHMLFMSDDETLFTQTIAQAASTSGRLQMLPVFRAFADSDYFKRNIWQRRPYHYSSPLPNIAGAFTMDDLKGIVDSEFLEAGRGTFQEGRGGWNMAAVSKPRGTSFQDAKLRYEDVLEAMAMKSGTVVFNSAGGFMPPMARVCLECLEAFKLPNALNMYLTAAGQQVSAPPHTDKQDVFVIQTQGQKRWRVYRPPPPSRLFRSDPFARGKGTDTLEFSELESPMIDTVLGPGQILYVPAGFPHTTGRACLATLLMTPVLRHHRGHRGERRRFCTPHRWDRYAHLVTELCWSAGSVSTTGRHT